MRVLQHLSGDCTMRLLPRPPSQLCWLAVLATVFIRSPIVVSQQRPGCRPGTYLDVSTGSCQACSDGVNFQDEEYNTQPRCLDCSVCRGIMITADACSAVRDTVCRCPNGFTTTIEGLCRPVNAGADVGTSVTDSNGRTVSVLTTGSDSDGHRSTEAKLSGVEATVLRSIDGKLDQLIFYVLSVLALIVLSMATLYPCIAIRTCGRCKKPREPFPHQTVDHFLTAAGAKIPESSTSCHVDEKDKEQQEKKPLITTLRMESTDSSGGNNSSTVHKRPSRGISTLEDGRTS